MAQVWIDPGVERSNWRKSPGRNIGWGRRERYRVGERRAREETAPPCSHQKK